MSTSAPFYISNDGEVTLASLLAAAVGTDPSRLDAAVGYFKPDVWQLIGQSFKDLQSFRLLIGAEPRIEGDTRGLDLAEYFARQIRGDLEDIVFDRAWATLMDDLIEFLRRDSVDVRLFQKIAEWHAPFLHAKAYILPSVSIVGSSNLTPAGLTKNVELNLVRTDVAAANELRNWFESRWEPSLPYKDDLIRALEESKFGDHPWTPYQVFIKALYEYFRDRLGPEEAVPIAGEPLDLAKFQRDGVNDARALLDRYRGCIVADATGLGKTYIGLELMREYFIKIIQRVRRPRFLVVCPAQLRDLVWRPRAREFLGFNVDIESMEALGFETFDPRKYIDYDFVLVDESHNFRHPSPRRYENLMTIVGTGKSYKYVVLLTATPINTSVYDIYHQIMLLARNRDDFFSVDGIASLIGYFKRVAKESQGLFDIIQRTVVRRTRFDIRRRQERGEVIKLGDEEVRFPQQTPPEPILYDLSASYGGFYQELVHDIDELRLAPYRLDSYRRGKITEDTAKTVQRENALAGIFKTVFLKRLESSVHAFRRSIQDQAEFQRAFHAQLEQGKLLGAGDFRRIRRLLKSEDDEQEARAEEIIDSLDEVAPEDYDLEHIEADVNADVTVLGGIEERLNKFAAEGAPDPKLDAVKAFIRHRLDGQLSHRKLLLFSYFRETAEYVYRGLAEDSEWLSDMGNPQLGLISGSTDADTRTRIVQRFAPQSNRPEGAGEDWRPDGEPIDILVSTDVLSEGQNLQDCGELLNYDLHWNPVRMIQRAGRINRLKALHSEVHVYNCFPEEELEDLLRIVRRLQQRIQEIDQSVGLDASVLGETVSEKSFEQLRRIREADASVIDDLQQQAELVTGEDMKIPLQAFMTEEGREALEKIPLGIRSARQGTTNGTFFAFRAAGTEGRDFHYWRFYPDDGGPPLTDMREIFHIIRCDEREPRIAASDPNRPHREDRRLDAVERATGDILKELRGQKGVATKPYEMRADEKRFWQAIKNPRLGEEVDEDVRTRVLTGLEHGIFAPVRLYHEWKQLVKEWRGGEKDTAWLTSQLDQLGVTWSLYSGSEFGAIGALRSLSEENLRLVCYELVV